MTDDGAQGSTAEEPESKRPRRSGRIAVNLVQQQEAAAEEAKAQRARDEAIRVATEQRRLDTPNDIALGQLCIAFVYMGQGDCTIVRTPGGRVILIDAGSSYADENTWDIIGTNREPADEAHDILYGPLFLNGGPALPVVVLTHGDTDHHDRIAKVVNKTTTVNRLYHSGEWSDYGAAATHLKPDSRYRVTVNHDPPHFTNLGPRFTLEAGGTGAADPAIDPRNLADGGVRILEEAGCTVTVVASDVSHHYVTNDGDPNGKNRASVVLLIEACGEKILLSGDATRNTEAFLRHRREAVLRQVTVVHASHHGSINTSSGADFLELLNPTRVSISAPREEPGNYHLPSAQVVENYTFRIPDHDAHGNPTSRTRHLVWAWEKSSRGVYTNIQISTELPIYTTGSQGTNYFVADPVQKGKK